MAPVSYTHLDVYKRQVLSGAWQFDGAAESHAGPSASAGANLVVTVDEEEPLIRFYIPTVIKPGG